ncbi:uncharacterized protein [Onthophagus taurus]|uniref:uncharacterized protein n=1 Tax=Onthophagus taurus TaxID=166361 RepID=UPI0039BE377F
MAEIVGVKLGLEWKFNPPGAPHFNGLAESNVKSVKTHLIKVIGSQVLSFEEMYTVLTQIEAVLNSRPLTPVSSDPNDLQALTPGHFLHLEPLNSCIVDPDLSTVPCSRLDRWQLLQKTVQDFWKRWKHDYLHTLQQRTKWTESSSNPVVGDMVLIKNENRPSFQWDLGRIEEIHPGKDGVVRVVTLKTCTGRLTRPVVKICPLPK